MSIADYLSALVSQKNALADNLNTMGVAASRSETLDTLVPKVLQIAGAGTLRLQSKIVTENGIVLPDPGYDALAGVMVNTPGGGGPVSFEYQLVEYLDFTPSVGILVPLPAGRTRFEAEFSSDLPANDSTYNAVFAACRDGAKDFELGSHYGAIYGWVRKSSEGRPIGYGTPCAQYERTTASIELYDPLTPAMIGRYTFRNVLNSEAFDGKFYRLSGYSLTDGSLVCRFLPCYRKFDGKPGVFETIGGTFHSDTYSHTDTGWSIVPGPDVVLPESDA